MSGKGPVDGRETKQRAADLRPWERLCGDDHRFGVKEGAGTGLEGTTSFVVHRLLDNLSGRKRRATDGPDLFPHGDDSAELAAAERLLLGTPERRG